MGYSVDFRGQVFKIKQKEKLTFQEVSDRFGVPIRTLFRWQNRIEPKSKRNKPSTKIDMEALRKDVEDNPDHFQYERAKKFGVSQSAIYYALRRLKISYKKNAIPS
ncbi:transposase [Gillisia sp. Hel_I_86]|uniref:IS630 transposase-related protein n=1 Tax=Gillisia sp. Hel_I_86 TaxID=1249981 RepID=UPI00119910AD|nr:IS630 transposase-related protein [Gillisia sp. Hel_I_86]TVZ25766.1 transposase [Gillisia sp. Hel_I_86]